MVSDISKSIKANLYERIASPLFGAFSIYWVVWNYKVILVLFSSMKVAEKITFIETKVYSGDYGIYLTGLIYPLVSAILFILIYPFPARWMYQYWNKQQKILKDIKQKIEGDTLLTLNESRLLRRELRRLEDSYDDEIIRKNNEIGRLKDEIALFDKKTNIKPNSHDEEQPGKAKKKEVKTLNDPEEISVLAEISNEPDGVYKKEYINKSKFNRVKVEYFLENLTNNGYLERYYNQNIRDNVFTLTIKGRKFLIERGFVE